MARRVRWSIVVSGVVAGVLVATALVLVERPIPGHAVMAVDDGGTRDACSARSPLTVVTPEVLAPMVRAAAQPLCIRLDLRTAAGRDGATASREPDVDVWITDSRLWAMARGELDPAAGTSLASSPVVMVVGTALADAVAGQDGASWGTTLRRQTMPAMGIGVQNPVATAVGLLAGHGVFAAAQAALGDEFTALSATAAGLARPRVLDATRLGAVGPTEVVFAAEYVADTATGGRVLYGREGAPYLDFPAYTITTDHGRRTSAAGLLADLASTSFADERASLALREPDGTARFSRPFVARTPSPRMPVPDQKTALRLFGLAQSGSVPGRNLVTVDVSGSMAAQVNAGETLMDVVRRSGLVALTALPDHSSIGLWEFASRIDGTRDHRELVPITPLATGRAHTMQVVRELDVIPNGATGLYDTVFAAYQELQRGYDPKAAQYLVVLTDGKNENDPGLDLDALLAAIRGAQDPAKPISLIAVGYGNADIASLQRIADVMTGSVYAVRAAEQIVGVLIDAIGRAHTA
jgi:hypothetical protein